MIGRYCGAAAAVIISDSAANYERGNNTIGNQIPALTATDVYGCMRKYVFSIK
jgi:hypothetical protein